MTRRYIASERRPRTTEFIVHRAIRRRSRDRTFALRATVIATDGAVGAGDDWLALPR